MTIDTTGKSLPDGRLPVGTIGLRTIKPAQATFEFVATTDDGRHSAPFEKQLTIAAAPAGPHGHHARHGAGRDRRGSTVLADDRLRGGRREAGVGRPLDRQRPRARSLRVAEGDERARLVAREGPTTVR